MNQAPLLNYVKRPRRRWRRMFVIFVCLLSVFASIRFCFIPAVRRYIRVRQLSIQQTALLKECMDHTYLAGTVVFDERIDGIDEPEDWAEAYLFTRRPVSHAGVHGDARGTRGYYWPWKDNARTKSSFNGLRFVTAAMHTNFVKCAYGMRPVKYYDIQDWADEVYTHARRCAGGKERLVIIGFDGPAFAYGSDAPFRAVVVTPPTALHELKMNWSNDAFGFKFNCPPEQLFRLYTGVSDTADESHFTIGYETSAGRGTIDGWLKPDDTVSVKVTKGPLAIHTARGMNSQFNAQLPRAALVN